MSESDMILDLPEWIYNYYYLLYSDPVDGSKLQCGENSIDSWWGETDFSFVCFCNHRLNFPEPGGKWSFDLILRQCNHI